MTRSRFVGYPAAVLYSAPNGKAAMQRLWGSFLPLTGKKQSGFLELRYGHGDDAELFWIHEDDTQERGTLELFFLDVGQGDACIITTPDNKKLVVDAGAGDNMLRFLRYRFRNKTKFDAFVITHPDEDHYFGFDGVLDDPRFSVRTIYHSGLVERTAATSSETLGRRQKVGGRSLVTGLVATKPELDALLTKARIGNKQYPAMLRKAVDSPRVADVRSIDASDGHLPGYGPGAKVTIEVLGPVPEVVGNSPALRWLSGLGKTKNGHSVVLRVVIGRTSILLGGDLNIPAEEYLLEHYTGEAVPPRTVEDEERLIRKGRTVFESDFAKSCHHGSADFTEFFLQAVNAHATVVSSGDDEPHAHPRADTLGTIGKHSRGRRSLIFSTELSRSAKELIKNPSTVRMDIRDAADALAEAHKTDKKIKSATNRLDKLLAEIQRSVSVYGAINMRTDGDRTIWAYKIERPRGKSHQWDIYTFGRDSVGDIVFDTKH